MITAPGRLKKRLLLVGAGHAHIEVLRKFAMMPEPELELVLVNPSAEALYSGMLPGFVAKQYSWQEISIDCAALAAACGAVLVRDSAVRVDAERRLLELRERPPLTFDFLSLNIGSQTAMPPLEDGVRLHPAFLAPRPFSAFRASLAHWDSAFARSPSVRILVLGSGAAGFELACALRVRFPRAKLMLLEGGEPLPARERQALHRAGIELSQAGKALWVSRQVESFHVKAERGELSAEFLVSATGAQAWPLVKESGLPEERGFLRVGPTLECEGVKGVFGAGDCIHFLPQPNLAKAGVFAVREAPVLVENLRAFARGEALREFRPQRNFLRLLNLGTGSAIASRWPLRAEGAWAWTWKDKIDRDFLEKYDLNLPPLDEPDCGGCGSKAAAEVVCELRAGAASASARVIWGTGAAEDVALWQSNPGSRLAITVDQFGNFGADPFLFGRIAAVAAASDLYAKGVAPEAALMTLTMPRLASQLAKSWAKQLSAGVQSVFTPEGIELLGGHTTEGESWNLGFTLWASAPSTLWPKRGLVSGDALLLTKPIGTGILLAAAMRSRKLGAALDNCLATMAQSQRLAWEALKPFQPHACTDVTGFSLLGHLSEMLERTSLPASDSLSAELNFSAIPFLEGAKECFAEGFHSRMHSLNQAGFPSALPQKAEILYDPQTSGGLLLSLPPAQAEEALRVLREAGLKEAAIIGRVIPSAGEKIRVLL